MAPGREDQALVLVTFNPRTATVPPAGLNYHVRLRIRTDGTEVVEDIPITIREVPS